MTVKDVITFIKSNKYVKLLLFFTLEFAIAFFSFIAIILAALSISVRDSYYYSIGFFVFAILLMIVTGISFYSKSKQLIKTSWFSWIIAFVLFVGVYESIRWTKKLVPPIQAPFVELERYQPFADSSLVALLNEPSALQLTDSLPRIDGATAFYPLYSAFVRAVYPNAYYDLDTSILKCSKTDYAFSELAYNHCDIIFAFAPSAEQENDAWDYDSVKFKLTPIGKEGFVFFVNAKNPVNSITTEQLRKIYSGEITNWLQLGGSDEKIKAFQRNANSGSQTAFIEFMKGYEIMKPPGEYMQFFMEGVIYETASYANYNSAIGYSFRYFADEMVANEGIKLLKIDGVEPTSENIKNNTYPLVFDFYAITRKNDITSNANKLIEWILSPQGQLLIEKTGYSPINTVN